MIASRIMIENIYILGNLFLNNLNYKKKLKMFDYIYFLSEKYIYILIRIYFLLFIFDCLHFI